MINFIAVQATEIKEILSIESVSVIGLMLLIICGLVYHIKTLEKRHEAEKVVLRAQVKEAHDKLEEEYKVSSTEMKGIIEKYYTITTKFLEKINTIIN